MLASFARHLMLYSPEGDSGGAGVSGPLSAMYVIFKAANAQSQADSLKQDVEVDSCADIR